MSLCDEDGTDCNDNGEDHADQMMTTTYSSAITKHQE
jgi:hypothetical protein